MIAEDTCMKKNREQWILVNLSSRTISTGFPNVRAIKPGGANDLLSTISKDDVRQSKGIEFLLKHNWARIDKVIDGVVITSITYENIGELSDTSLDANSDGDIDLQGQSINLNAGVGSGGGNVNLEGGSLNLNNDVSIQATGTVISTNCSELVTAADLTVFGRLTTMNEIILGLPESEPNLSDNNTFTFFQDGDDFVVKARNKDGKIVKVALANFVQDGQ